MKPKKSAVVIIDALQFINLFLTTTALLSEWKILDHFTYMLRLSTLNGKEPWPTNIIYICFNFN